MNIILPIRGKIVINNQRNLLNVNSSSQQIGSNENPTGSASKMLHDFFTLLLIHITVLQWREVVGKHVILDEHKTKVNMIRTIDDTVWSFFDIWSVSHSTLRLVLQNITAWVILNVSYKSLKVSNFQSSLSTFT